jgi:phthalate 4,5-dioxygenase oxygenase subunit
MREGKSFTGIEGISNEDTAMQEAQGPLTDRSQEHLIAADLGIIRMRQGILGRVRDLQKGILPEGRSEDIPFRLSQSVCWTYPADKDWKDDHKAYIDADENSVPVS